MMYSRSIAGLARTGNRLLRILLVLTAAVSQAGGEGAVLCICADGHVSLELSCDTSECCADELLLVATASPGWGAVAPSATAPFCTDIPLLASSDPAIRQNCVGHSAARSVASINGAQIFANKFQVNVSHARPMASSGVVPSYSPTSKLRTVALLI